MAAAIWGRSISRASSWHRSLLRIDHEQLVDAVRVAVRMLDNVIDASRFSLPAQAENARGSRRVGLGITGLADALVMLGMGYGSEQSLAVAERTMRLICHAAYRTSIGLAKEKGSFPFLDRDKYLQGLFIRGLPDDIQLGIAESASETAICSRLHRPEQSVCSPEMFQAVWSRSLRLPIIGRSWTKPGFQGTSFRPTMRSGFGKQAPGRIFRMDSSPPSTFPLTSISICKRFYSYSLTTPFPRRSTSRRIIRSRILSGYTISHTTWD